MYLTLISPKSTNPSKFDNFLHTSSSPNGPVKPLYAQSITYIPAWIKSYLAMNNWYIPSNIVQMHTKNNSKTQHPRKTLQPTFD